MCEGWGEPYWAEYNKHWPQPGKTWQEIIASTNEGKKVAKYRPSLKRSGGIRPLEMSYREQGHFMVQRTNKRYYFIESPEVIGASLGERTQFVLVQRNQDGSVHGYPQTKDEIEKYWRKYQQLPLPPPRERA